MFSRTIRRTTYIAPLSHRVARIFCPIAGAYVAGLLTIAGFIR